VVLNVANTVSSLKLEIAFPEVGRILAVNRMKELVIILESRLLSRNAQAVLCSYRMDSSN